MDDNRAYKRLILMKQTAALWLVVMCLILMIVVVTLYDPGHAVRPYETTSPLAIDACKGNISADY